MKRNNLFFLILLLPATGFSQNDEIRTIFSGDVKHGAYMAPEMRLSSFKGSTGMLMGGRGGWVINHRLVFGAAGYGLVTTCKVGEKTPDSIMNLRLGYGGLLMEYVLFHGAPVHLSIPVIIGAGGNDIVWKNRFAPSSEYISLIEKGSYFFIEPGALVELNMTKFLRFDLGMSYRYVGGMAMENISEEQMSGLSFNILFKFGLF